MGKEWVWPHDGIPYEIWIDAAPLPSGGLVLFLQLAAGKSSRIGIVHGVAIRGQALGEIRQVRGGLQHTFETKPNNQDDRLAGCP